MMRGVRIVTFVLLVSCLTACLALADLSDPYEILEKHYEAVGSVDQIKALRTRHAEGTIVIEGTPAFKAGFQAGDIIRSVNGIDTKYLGGLISLREMLREKPGTEYKIEVVRGDKSKELQLALRDLYER